MPTLFATTIDRAGRAAVVAGDRARRWATAGGWQSLSHYGAVAGRTAADALLDLVLPPCCCLCQSPVAGGQDFCHRCDRDLRHSEVMMRQACPRCGHPVAGPAVIGLPGSTTDRSGCPHCQRRQLHFSAVIALWMYRYKVCDAVVAAKYPRNAALGDTLGRRLGQRVRNAIGDDPPDCVTFVPSHLSRQLSRGGIGTQSIAQAVATSLGLPCLGLLRTTRRIGKQAWLDDQQRQANVRDAFRIRKSYALRSSPELTNRHILLVDDVMTTGATANEVARVLCVAGARRVSLAVVAHAARTC